VAVIFLDANYILRALVPPTTPQDQPKAAEAIALLRAVAAGAKEATTSESVVAEVAFVLTAPRHYGLSAADAAGRLQPIIGLRGLKLSGKKRLQRAFDVWVREPHLGFVDALTVAYAEQPGIELATFDSDFDGVAGITRYTP
jgi:predicted nucleic acid-binding protein